MEELLDKGVQNQRSGRGCGEGARSEACLRAGRGCMCESVCVTLTRGRRWTLRGPSEKELGGGPWGTTRGAGRLTQGRERDALKGGRGWTPRSPTRRLTLAYREMEKRARWTGYFNWNHGRGSSCDTQG